ncbi:putative iron siderophore sensor protein [Hyphomicrobium sulfonivorans]|uniref:Putative iron siderophore sensor protein n=1 Tax=Hyphomicrobium sulfonivorans TaxID=121290 RepID=A0A120CU80_HYPSL|nr:FecR family protein [Hyphomicrobium sulfonivorans]KWT65815.1 putative iron siderophore sensor protein [Hyphomicrobium sulfonivorans]
MGVDREEADYLRIVEEAAAWFAKLNDGKPSSRYRQAFSEWLNSDPRHADAYADIQRLWDSAGEIPVLKEHDKALKTKKVTRRQLGVAAMLLASGALLWRLAPSGPHPDFQTATGQRKTVTLADGTRVELAAQTQIALGFTPETRRVVLLAGEAFFEVAPAPERPFVVDAGSASVRALGTAFAVSREAQDVRVLVTEHAVRLSSGTRNVEITSGHSAAYDGYQISAPEAADMRSDLAWREGRLVFTHAPFGQVAATINRWRTGRLIVVGEELVRQPVTVIAEIDQLDAVIARLGEILPTRIVEVGPWLTLAFPR